MAGSPISFQESFNWIEFWIVIYRHSFKIRKGLPWEVSLLPLTLNHSGYLPWNITDLLCLLLEAVHNIHANHMHLSSSSQKGTHSNISLPCFLCAIKLGVGSVSVYNECPYSSLWLCHGPWHGHSWCVFRIVMYWLWETFPVVLSRLLVYMAWLWAAKERMLAQRWGETTGPDYEWGWPRQIWVTRTKSRAGEPHARWWSLAKGHLWLIFTSPDGPHLKQWHWPSFTPGWKKHSLRGPERQSDVSCTFWHEVDGYLRVSDFIKPVQSEKEFCVCLRKIHLPPNGRHVMDSSKYFPFDVFVFLSGLR